MIHCTQQQIYASDGQLGFTAGVCHLGCRSFAAAAGSLYQPLTFKC